MTMTRFDTLSSAYDRGMRPLEALLLRRLRQKVFPALQGDILEIGVGTGVNLPLYSEGTTVVAGDISRDMLARSTRRAASARLIQFNAQQLPFASERFDVVAGSLVFCSIDNPQRGLSEVKRVLRPGGRLILLEHMRGHGLGKWLTELFQPLWHTWSRSCNLNRQTLNSIVSAGFHVLRVEEHWLGIFRLMEARC
jgi:ubiquinone/menaquinone biosynthesis C-methylase UbiE